METSLYRVAEGDLQNKHTQTGRGRFRSNLREIFCASFVLGVSLRFRLCCTRLTVTVGKVFVLMNNSHLTFHFTGALHGIKNMKAESSCTAPTPLPAVPRVELTDASAEILAKALKSAIAKNLPVVFVLGAASELLPRWTPSFLVRHVPTLHGVYESPSSPRFGPYHDVDRPFGRAFGLDPLHNYTEDATVSTREFFAAATHEADRQPYRYYSGEVERDLPHALLEELRPLESALIAHGPTRASVNLWLGSSPVVAPCHYDGYHSASAGLDPHRPLFASPRLLRPRVFLSP